MTGRQLLNALQALDASKLSHPVLIGIEDRWLQLDTITFDTAMKTIDLEGGTPKHERESDE